jgi:hypothetical protein
METKAALRVEVTLDDTTCSLSRPCPVTVTLNNVGEAPVRVNGRLAAGYRQHLAREIFAELLNPTTGEPAPIREVDYDRNFSPVSDYILLEPGQRIEATFDLSAWYAPVEPGDYRLVVYYQGDENLASPPADVGRGIYASEPVDLEVRRGQPG